MNNWVKVFAGVAGVAVALLALKQLVAFVISFLFIAVMFVGTTLAVAGLARVMLGDD